MANLEEAIFVSNLNNFQTFVFEFGATSLVSSVSQTNCDTLKYSVDKGSRQLC